MGENETTVTIYIVLYGGTQIFKTKIWCTGAVRTTWSLAMMVDLRKTHPSLPSLTFLNNTSCTPTDLKMAQIEIMKIN